MILLLPSGKEEAGTGVRGIILYYSEQGKAKETGKVNYSKVLYKGLGGANPAVNTPRPSRGTRIESCDFIVLIGDP